MSSGARHTAVAKCSYTAAEGSELSVAKGEKLHVVQDAVTLPGYIYCVRPGTTQAGLLPSRVIESPSILSNLLNRILPSPPRQRVRPPEIVIAAEPKREKREPAPPPQEAEALGLVQLARDAGVMLSAALYTELVRMAEGDNRKLAELLLSWRDYAVLCKIVEIESLQDKLPPPKVFQRTVEPSLEHPSNSLLPPAAITTLTTAPPPQSRLHPSLSAPNASEDWGPLIDSDTGMEQHIPIELHLPLSFSHQDKQAYGPWRGIQAENNSCYLDSTLYALFAFSTSFDRHFSRTTLAADPKAQEFCAQLWKGVIGPLRARNYVCCDAMRSLRALLNHWLPGNSASNGSEALMQRDVEEFLHVVFGKILAVHPFASLASEAQQWRDRIDLCILQLMVDPSSAQLRDCMNPATDQLLQVSMAYQRLRFREMPEVLLLQMPRYGPERIFERIYPAPTLDLSPYLLEQQPQSSSSNRMRLSAVITIAIGHYVAFVSSPLGEWYLYDGMADRIDDRANVPCLTYLPNTAPLLSPAGQHHFTRGEFPPDRTPEDRLLRDAYLCIYIK